MQIFEINFEEKLTPVSVFSAVRACFGAPCALLESLHFDVENKFSLVATRPIQSVVSSENSFEKIRKAIKKCRRLPANFRFAGGMIGVFSFEIFDEIEPKIRKTATSDWPRAIFFEFEFFVFFDHDRSKIIFCDTGTDPNFLKNVDKICATARDFVPAEVDLADFQSADFSKFESEQNFEDFAEKVGVAKRKIRDGEIFQVILSNEFSCECGSRDGLEFYEILRKIEPTTHLFLLDFADFGQVVGASPEILGSKRGKQVLYRPIAGTRFRGTDAMADRAILAEMRASEKENAEHDMLLDLGRNDLGRVCRGGSVRILREKYAKFFANVMHLVSDLAGEIDAENFDAVDFFRAIFPAGTLTGAPKIRAVQTIRELENFPRDLYGGAVGYFSADQNMEFCIAIRSFFLKNGVARFQVGAGIVQDSTATHEWLEIQNKSKTLCKIFNFVLKS